MRELLGLKSKPSGREGGKKLHQRAWDRTCAAFKGVLRGKSKTTTKTTTLTTDSSSSSTAVETDTTIGPFPTGAPKNNPNDWRPLQFPHCGHRHQQHHYRDARRHHRRGGSTSSHDAYPRPLAARLWATMRDVGLVAPDTKVTYAQSNSPLCPGCTDADPSYLRPAVEQWCHGYLAAHYGGGGGGGSPASFSSSSPRSSPSHPRSVITGRSLAALPPAAAVAGLKGGGGRRAAREAAAAAAAPPELLGSPAALLEWAWFAAELGRIGELVLGRAAHADATTKLAHMAALLGLSTGAQQGKVLTVLASPWGAKPPRAMVADVGFLAAPVLEAAGVHEGLREGLEMVEACFGRAGRELGRFEGVLEGLEAGFADVLGRGRGGRRTTWGVLKAAVGELRKRGMGVEGAVLQLVRCWDEEEEKSEASPAAAAVARGSGFSETSSDGGGGGSSSSEDGVSSSGSSSDRESGGAGGGSRASSSAPPTAVDSCLKGLHDVKDLVLLSLRRLALCNADLIESFEQGDLPAAQERGAAIRRAWGALDKGVVLFRSQYAVLVDARACAAVGFEMPITKDMRHSFGIVEETRIRLRGKLDTRDGI